MARPHTGNGGAGSTRRELDVILAVNDENEFISVLNSSEAVTVVDMYPHFCGPCDAMTNVFKRLKVDYQNQVLFIQALTDNISFFESIRDHSCPMFSIWVNGIFVNFIRGANSPLLERIIKEQVELSKITKDRKPGIPEVDIPQIIRPGIHFKPGEHNLRMSFNLDDNQDFEDSQFIVSIIKPDCVLPHIIAEVLSTANLNRFDIVKQRRLWLTELLAKQLYTEHSEKPFFHELIEYITSGPIIVLLLTQKVTSDSNNNVDSSIINVWRQIIGPVSPSHAKEIAPNSLRAQFGRDGLHNGFHSSDSLQAAQHEMELLFAPSIPTLPTIPINTDITMTVMVLSPEVTADSIKVEQVIQRILFKQIDVLKRGQSTLTSEQVNEWLRNSTIITDEIITHWTNGPVLAMVLKGEDVITLWNEFVYGTIDQTDTNPHPHTLLSLLGVNDSIRCSLTTEQAHRDMNIFFPRPDSTMPGMKPPSLERTIALIKPDAVIAGKANEIMSKIQDRGFKIIDKKLFTMTMDIAKEFYRDHIGKPFFDELTTWMTSSPIWALVLEKESAITGWREVMGPTNSIKAKEVAPDTLRAIYGTDGSKNALHGSDSMINAIREITLLFSEQHTMVSSSTSRNASRLPSRVSSNINLGISPSVPVTSNSIVILNNNEQVSIPVETKLSVSTQEIPKMETKEPLVIDSNVNNNDKIMMKNQEEPSRSRRPSSTASTNRSRPGSSNSNHLIDTQSSRSSTTLSKNGVNPRPPSHNSRTGSRASLRKSKAQLTNESNLN